MSELSIFLTSVRDAYVQVSAFVAVTVLAFGYLQYRTDGRLVRALGEHARVQPLVGAALGLTPGCGGAIVVMPLYVRGTVSFGTVVATLVATAGDSAFVVLALAPEAALAAYGVALATAVATGYAIDTVGLGVGRVDRAVARFAGPVADGGSVTADGPADAHRDHGHDSCGTGPGRESRLLTPVSHAVHAAWWITAALGLGLGLAYLVRGAPEVALTLGPSFDGLFTAVGITGTTLSVYLYATGRHYLGDGDVGRARDSFANAYDTLVHAATETSFVTVWVVAAYLLYEYGVVATGVDVAGVAAAAGLLAPVAGAVVGVIPGCGPQIVLAGVYAEGALPFSTLVANAVSQDGDALFPLLAVDRTAAIVATVYTTLPALAVGIALHVAFGPMIGFGTLG